MLFFVPSLAKTLRESGLCLHIVSQTFQREYSFPGISLLGREPQAFSDYLTKALLLSVLITRHVIKGALLCYFHRASHFIVSLTLLRRPRQICLNATDRLAHDSGN